MSKTTEVVNNILYPVIVTMVGAFMTWGYNKFEAYEELLNNYPKVQEDVSTIKEIHEEIQGIHDIKDDIVHEYKIFKYKTNDRLEKLERANSESHQDIFQKIDSIDSQLKKFEKSTKENTRRTNILKSYH